MVQSSLLSWLNKPKAGENGSKPSVSLKSASSAKPVPRKEQKSVLQSLQGLHNHSGGGGNDVDVDAEEQLEDRTTSGPTSGQNGTTTISTSVPSSEMIELIRTLAHETEATITFDPVLSTGRHICTCGPRPGKASRPVGELMSPCWYLSNALSTVSLLFPVKVLPSNISISALREADITEYRFLNQAVLPLPYSTTFYQDTVKSANISPVSLAGWLERPILDFRRTSNNSRQKPIIPKKDDLIGAIRCILLPCKSRDPSDKVLYISTLATYASHRSQGLGANLILQAVTRGVTFLHMRLAAKDPETLRLATSTETRKGISDKLLCELGPYLDLSNDEDELGCGANALKQLPTKLHIRAVLAHVWSANEEGLSFYHKLGFQDVEVLEGYYPLLSPPDAILLRKKLE